MPAVKQHGKSKSLAKNGLAKNLLPNDNTSLIKNPFIGSGIVMSSSARSSSVNKHNVVSPQSPNSSDNQNNIANILPPLIGAA